MTTKVLKNASLTSAAFAIVAFSVSSVFAAQGPLGQNVHKTVFEQPIPHQTVDAAYFAVDRDLGRAWIDVELASTEIDKGPEWSPPVTNVVQRRLEGLHYDPARKQVLYGNGPSAVVCADDLSSPGSALKTTGQCELKVSSETRRVDDGFTPQEEAVGKVVFEVP
jgi:hypothetical protein